MVALVPDDGGFTVSSSPPIHVAWECVDRIVANKADLFGYDLICLAFSVASDGKEIEITEEDIGGELFSMLSTLGLA